MDIYDRFVSTFRTPSLMLRSNYFGYASKPSPYYKTDDAFFVANSHRRSFLRPAYCGEFDMTPDDRPYSETLPKLKYLRTFGVPDAAMLSAWRHIPRLYVLIQRITPDTHNVTALLRGRAFWPMGERNGQQVDTCQSDAELTPVLKQISAIEGFDVKAWQDFEQHFNRIVIGTQSNNITVN